MSNRETAHIYFMANSTGLSQEANHETAHRGLIVNLKRLPQGVSNRETAHTGIIVNLTELSQEVNRETAHKRFHCKSHRTFSGGFESRNSPHRVYGKSQRTFPGGESETTHRVYGKSQKTFTSVESRNSSHRSHCKCKSQRTFS